MMTLAKLLGLVLTILCWRWSLSGSNPQFIYPRLQVLVPLLTVVLVVIGRCVLKAHPDRRTAEWTNILVHHGIGIVLGSAIFAAISVVTQSPEAHLLRFPRQVGWWLFMITGAATAFSVLNLAIRGLGAPFVIKLSSRLASDWMYSWTRNPMVLCTLAWFLSYGLWKQSLSFLLFILVVITPSLLFFVVAYEERELALRFGQSYLEYKSRTPFLIPRRPSRQELARKASA
jgi:protein-S-isoprenylcysteine O-methyltransferase Ste14